MLSLPKNLALLAKNQFYCGLIQFGDPFPAWIGFLMQLQLFMNKEKEKFYLDRIELSCAYFSEPSPLFSLSRMDIIVSIHYDLVRGSI
jgi:hypothetical protein